MFGGAALQAIARSGARGCRSHRRRLLRRLCAPAASDRFAPKRIATQQAARPHPRRNAEIVYGEVSAWRRSVGEIDELHPYYGALPLKLSALTMGHHFAASVLTSSSRAAGVCC